MEAPMSQDWQQPFNEGMAHGSAGRYPEAIESLTRAIDLAPDEPYPHYELGFTLSLLGRHEEALEEFRRTEALAHGFFSVQTEIYLSEHFLSGDIDASALGWLRDLQTLTDTGGAQSQKATSIARMVTRRAPDLALGYFYVGKSLLGRSPEEAQQALVRCVELGPDETIEIDAKGHLGLLLRGAGREADAQMIWRTAVEDHPGHPHLGIIKMLLSTDSSD
jgi:tetratricopeptide (TPR) repeat protein